ncbi:MAG: porin family protein [Robiginitomaculum sp.]|nr:porin family protein [Robiginitomaculum sp.]
MKKLLILSTAALCFTATPAFAGEGTYINLGGAYVDEGGFVLFGRGGYNFAENFGVEAEAGLGIADKSDTLLGVDVKTGVNFSVGAFGVGRVPLGENFNIFGRVGYHYSEVEAKAGNFNAIDHADGIAFGGGIEYMLDDNNGIRAEYTSYDGDGGSLDAFGVSYVRKF